MTCGECVTNNNGMSIEEFIEWHGNKRFIATTATANRIYIAVDVTHRDLKRFKSENR